MHLKVGDWYRLGLSLNIKPYELGIINKDCMADTNGQTCKMLELWLRTQPQASYQQLIQALHEVGDGTVADSLCKECGKYRTST